MPAPIPSGDAERIFLDLVEIEPHLRAARLDQICADRRELRREVQTLLDAAERSAGYFARLRRHLGLSDGGDDAPPAHANPAGQTIGPYTLTRRLGRGGMGDVWLARRSDGRFDGQVAIKLLAAPGATTRHSFEREARHLARLAHPNIARLLDADATQEGRPFLVLEFVEGEPIDRYCDSRRLTIEQRVRLFLQVLAGIAHAHANLVVHRDIKPSNVWVTTQGEVKVLDFGISKLVAGDDTATDVAATQTLALALTPQFAAPEQVEGSAVTTATDVYALGMLLWSLVAGRTERSGRELRSMAQLRAAAGMEPGSLIGSACQGQSQQGLAELAWLRSVGIEPLRKLLRGDLDSVLRKAVAVDARERYATAGEFAQDLQHWLAHRPVAAGPPSAGRRLRLFVRRHRLGVAGGAVAALMLAVIVAQAVNYTLATARQSAVIARERDRAEQVQRFLVGVFASADPNESKGAEVSAREILDRATARIGSEFAGQDTTRADLTQVIGIIYGSLSEQALAQRLLEESLALRERSEPGSATHADTLTELARLVTIRGDYERAESLARHALEIRDALGEPTGIVHAAGELGMVLHRRDRLDEAERHYRRALALARAELGAHPLTPRALHTLGSLLEQRGQLDEAEQLHREGLELRRSLVGELHLDMIESHYNLAMVQYRRGQYELALQSHQRGLEVIRTVTPQGHSDAQYMLNGMAQAHEKLGQTAQAQAHYREALTLIRRQFGDDHPNAAIVRANLGRLLAATGQTDEAEPLLRSALDTMTRSIPLSPRRLQAAEALARIELARGRHDAAEALLLSAHQAAPTPASAGALVELYEAWGNVDKAAQFRALASGTGR